MAAAAGLSAQPPGDGSQELTLPPAAAATTRVAVSIELQDAPAALAYASVIERAGTRDAQTLAAAANAGRAQIPVVEAAQAQVAAVIAGPAFNASEIFRVRRAMNAIVAVVDAGSVAALERVPGVKAVRVIEPEYPNNSSGVPFIGAPAVWGGVTNATGAGVRIGVIDTGVDYQHATFGSSGLLADYQANDRTVAPDAYFPTAKVVGGHDFAGDAYTGSNSPTPDSDPMDCNGHGTHVAGTAAGFGVNADGSTFAGPFNASVPFSSLRIGPGSAPGASVYALRVFGCGGSTSLTVQAIDWAMDPNNDNDLSDHLDVINMSLGSSYGSLSSATAIAADNASAAGVIVVASAGNSGDTYFISGSPGSGSRVIAIAASSDEGVPGAGVHVNAPGGIVGDYTAGTASFGPPAPPAGATGDVVLGLDPADGAGPLTTDGCSPLTNAAAIAGNIALIDRGTCGFAVKVKNGQDAGAIAVIIANSAAGVFGNMGGADPTVVIPSVMVTFADGNTFKASIPGLNVTLFSGADTIGSFSSRGPRVGSSPFQLKPDLAAPGVAITSAQTGVTCTASGCQTPNATGYLAGSQSLVLQGTSMAAPHAAGVMALLRQLHPTWTVEELKALVMNTALHDVTLWPGGSGARYGPGRVGAGRVDAALAAQAPVVAFNADDDGLVSVSFDGAVFGTASRTKRVRVVNHSPVAQTYDLAIDTVVDAPGVSYSLPGGSTITVPAGESIEIEVLMTADASQMEHSREATVAATQTAPTPLTTFGNPPRHWLTEEAGYLTLGQSGTTRLRVPVHTAPIPQSSMGAPATLVTGGAPTGSTTIALAGTDVCTGTLAAGPTCNGTFPTDEVSVVTPFELQVVSPADPANLRPSADLQYAGVAYIPSADQFVFGVSTWGSWATPTDTTFNIYLDTNNDGTWDRIVFNTNTGTLAQQFGTQTSGQDVFMVASYTIIGGSVNVNPVNRFLNRVSASTIDSRVFDNQVAFLPIERLVAGITGPFRYQVLTCPGSQPLCQALNGFHYDEALGPYSWNHLAQGLDFGGTYLAEDLNGATLPVTWNTANMATNGSLGALLLHHHNRPGERAEVVLLDGAPHTDLGITLAATPPVPTVGETVTLTATVTNNGPTDATNVQVTFDLPSGLVYDSDDGNGAYDTGSRTWTIAALPASASAVLQLAVTDTAGGALTARAAISSASLLDAVPGNNVALLGLTAPARADLEVTAAATVSPVIAGNGTGYTVTVTNHGDDTAYNVLVTTNLIAGFGSIQSGVPAAGVFDLPTREWRISSLGSGSSATLTLNVFAVSGPLLTAQATAASAVADPTTANNTASASVTVTPRSTSMTLGLTPNLVEVGDSSVVTVTVTDTAGLNPANPTGTVALISSVPGDGFTSIACILAPLTGSNVQSSCQVSVTPASSGARQITANYPGAVMHGGNTTAATLNVDRRPTTTTVETAPTSVLVDASSVVTVTVIEGAGGTSINPAGNVQLVSSVTGDVFSSGTCALAPMAATTDRSSCQVTVTPSTAGIRQITATYAGSIAHVDSLASQSLTVDERATTTTAANAAVFSTDDPQDVTLTATIASGRSVDEGTVTFTVRDSLGGLVGVPVTSAPITAGAATATYVLPGGTLPQALTIEAAYVGGNRFLDSSDTASLDVSQRPFTYLLAEGATGPFLDTDILLANPNPITTPITIRFMTDTGATVTQNLILQPMTRTTIHVDEIDGLEAASFSTLVDSTGGSPLVVERTMRWDATGYGVATEKATDGPASTWYFAEGSQGYFHTYFLLANPHNASNVAHVTYLLDGGGVVQRDYPLAPASRLTIDAGADAALVDRSFGATVVFDRPGMAERAMYFDADRPFAGGSASAGVTAPSTSWRLAEGATGTFFNTFLLIANPGADPATLTLTYLLDSGGTVTRTHPVGGQQRLTINVAEEDPLLAGASFATSVESDRPVVVERSMYWPAANWYESHTSAGVTAPALRWGLAEGQVGGPSHAQTYILVGNPGDTPAEIAVTFLKVDGDVVVKTFTAAPRSRLNIAIAGAGSHVPELVDEPFAAAIQSTQPVVVERSLYFDDASGVTWAAGGNATATRLP
jgi:uncharacterized repeat protein (TIGR01451 family)